MKLKASGAPGQQMEVETDIIVQGVHHNAGRKPKTGIDASHASRR
jgi:hypothetical protein